MTTDNPAGPVATFAELEQSIRIDAAPARVWELITDLPRMASWSPQVVRTVVRGPVGLGTRSFNLNRRGLLVWPTRAKVVRFTPERELALRIKDNKTIWSFTLTPDGDGTEVVQRREVPNGISDISVKLTQVAFGGQDNFAGELRDGMRQTLERLKAEAER